MIHRGKCHCGSVRAEYETSAPVRLRSDGCSFCSSRGVKSASDPNGTLVITSDGPLTRYRFGQRTADFLLCPVCGTYAATMMDGPNGLVGVINVVGMAIAELKDAPAELTSLDGETVEARNARRLGRWTPMRLVEG